MTRTVSLFTVLMLLVCGMAAAQTLEEVLDGYYQALGGLDKIKSVQTMRVTGKMSMMGGGMEAPLLMEKKRPNLHRVEFTINGITGIRAYDGETAWMLMPFMGKDEPEVMPEEQAKEVRDEADFDGELVDWAEKGHTLELVGKEDMEGTETFKLKLTKKSEDVLYYYLDSEYFLPLKVEGKREMGEQEITVESYLGDYKEVEGLVYPFAVENRSGEGGFSQTLTMETIELNVEIEDERFKMPEVEKKEDAAAIEEEGVSMKGPKAGAGEDTDTGAESDTEEAAGDEITAPASTESDVDDETAEPAVTESGADDKTD